MCVLLVRWLLLQTINNTGKTPRTDLVYLLCADLVPCCAVLCDAVLLLQTIITKVKTYHKVLQAFVTNAKLELTLLVTLQVCVSTWGTL